MRGVLFLTFVVFFSWGFSISFAGVKDIDKGFFTRLTSWAVQFFDKKYYNTSSMIKGATKGLGSVSMNISCEKGKDFYYLLIKKGSAVRNVPRRYRVAAADYFGEGVCKDGVEYKITAYFSSKELYSDPVSGARCGDYYYNLCLYKYIKGKLEGQRCYKHDKSISYCFK
ncbi:hypothetical protein [Persephonella sp. KM09-Lau-8]|uniref:hypothetical protein n=1 Tax=Persephonella sp. KM09-Lau-8 TaxID=1158345 RepID=UPI0012DFCADD|nr:hypothetical protein [Persephonella sp. KM09-Lau-8]